MDEGDLGANMVSRSYLLRLWRASASGPLRATLIVVSGSARPQHFVTLDALLAFLLAQADWESSASDGSSQVVREDALYCTPADDEHDAWAG